MSEHTYILIDRENDRREANKESSWDNVEDCKSDIVEGIKEGSEEKDYLPWRIVLFEPGKDNSDMNVHSKIMDVVTQIELKMFGGGS
jgi:hypothetical protein